MVYFGCHLSATKGYADMVFLPRKGSDKPAMVVELKWNQSGQGAIEQIKEKKYGKGLQEYSGKLRDGHRVDLRKSECTIIS